MRTPPGLLALVLEADVRSASSGKPFVNLSLRLEDGREFQGCKIWGAEVAPRGVIEIHNGKFDSFNGKEQIVVNDYTVEKTPDYSKFEAKCPLVNIDEKKPFYKKVYEDLLGSISHEGTREFVTGLLKHCSNEHLSGAKRTMSTFFTHPGARRNHHAYRYGLFQHSLEVASYALSNAKPAGLNSRERDLLIAGCLIHDIGKLEEYHVVDGVKYEMTSDGYLYGGPSNGHLQLGSSMLTRHRPTSLDLIDEEGYSVLQNIVLSHHGPWGSVPPASTVAIIAHKADGISSDLNRMQCELMGKKLVERDNTRQSYIRIDDYEKETPKDLTKAEKDA